MTVEEEIQSYSAAIEELRRKVGILSLRAYVQPGDRGRIEPLFVVDLDTAQLTGYADRYFDTMFGLQRIFARPVDMWEQEIFDREKSRIKVRPVSLELQHAA
jgi:hypothetical protein